MITARFTLTCAAVLALVGCKNAAGTDETTQADSVEVAAERAVGGLDPAAVPIADPGASATDSPAAPIEPKASATEAQEVIP